MKIAILGSTGAVGGECLKQSVAAGHDVSVLVRSPNKLDPSLADKIHVIKGDALNRDDIASLVSDVDAVLFAVGVDKNSPEDLCTDITRHILDILRESGAGRLIWCGGGSTLVPEDHMSFGAKFVNFFAKTFLGLRHRDKDHQYALLQEFNDVKWLGVRPLQIKVGPHTGQYETGFIPFSGMSSISFSDVADQMLKMVDDDIWLNKAPIVRY